MSKLMLPIIPIGIALISLFPTPLYSQYCYADTVIVSGELGGLTLIENSSIIRAENATFSSDGGLIGQDAVVLLPNFHVKAGVNFTASVIDCRGNKPYINIPAENDLLDNGCMEGNNPIVWPFQWNEVDGATIYQLNVTYHTSSLPFIDELLTTNEFTYIHDHPDGIVPNFALDYWVIKIRAWVNGAWTPWYGSQGNQPLVLSAEPVSTDCPPLITFPLPQDTLDNGCNGVNELQEWHFEWTEVEGATEYQLVIKHPSIGMNTFDVTVPTNSWTYSQFNQINTYFTGWTAKVRAKVDGIWTAYHGSMIEEEVMSFNVEPVSSDCAPKITAPLPAATLANGTNCPNNFIEWTFKVVPQPVSEMVEIEVRRPNGSVYLPSDIVYYMDAENDTITYTYRILDNFFPSNELTNWSVQARSRINGDWTAWYGDGIHSSQIYFNLAAPNLECVPVITSPLPNAVLDNGCDGNLNHMDWHFEWTEVPNATEYQLIIKHPNLSGNTFNEIVTTNSWSYHQIDRISNLYTGWTAKVRAKLNGVWTSYYGSNVAEETMTFDIEVKNTDCAPFVLLPTPNDVLDNGCETDPNNHVIWTFKNKELEDATDYEIQVLDPDGNSFFYFENEGYRETWKLFFSHTILPTTNLLGWSVQFRAKLNGLWSPWYGHAFNTTKTYFNLEPLDTDCSNMVSDEMTSRSSIKPDVLNKSANFKVYPNPFQKKTTIEYTVSKPSKVQLTVYTLTGKLVTVLTEEEEQPLGNYSFIFKANDELPNGMYLVRLQVGEVIQFKKIILSGG